MYKRDVASETGHLDDLLTERISLTPAHFIGGKIRRARKTAGLSHDRLGEKVGASRQHLIRLEQGEHRPRPRLLRAIAEATDRPVEFFVKRGSQSPFRPNGNGRS